MGNIVKMPRKLGNIVAYKFNELSQEVQDRVWKETEAVLNVLEFEAEYYLVDQECQRSLYTKDGRFLLYENLA